MKALLICLLLASPLLAETVDIPTPLQGENAADAWVFSGGDWAIADGMLTQTGQWYAESAFTSTAHAFLRDPVLSDFTLSFEFNVDEPGRGVGAPEVLLRSTDNRSYYLVQFSTKVAGVFLSYNDRDTFWSNIKRAYEVPMPRGEWNSVTVAAKGPNLSITVNDKLVLEAQDDRLKAGLIGFGSSQAVVSYRRIAIQGERVELAEPWEDTGGKFMKPEFRVICEDAGAGGYEAFPDVCRCANGDLLVVCYAGYDHVSFPREDLPKGARICAVRSTDDGETWGEAFIVADTPWDDRDPHICCLKDGRLICNWFTYYGGREDVARPGSGAHYKELWTCESSDNGVTWTEPKLIPNTTGAHWGCSGPIRELSDGTLIWPIYREYRNPLRNWSAVLRSSDGGETWCDPIWVDEDNADNDEPDICEMPDGRLLCMMRSNGGDSMWYSWSEDKGLTWSKSKKVGFPGHAPYMLRTADGVLLVGHRLPSTSLHYSLDDGKTWSDTVQMDVTIGAYPSMVVLRDGTVLFVYYEEGAGSSIRAQRLKVTREGVESIGWGN